MMTTMKHKNIPFGFIVTGALMAALIALAPRAGESFYRMEDSLRGSSTGNVSGGSFGADGWTVMGNTDRIWYAIPTLGDGFIEFTVTGLSTDNLLLNDHEIFAMYEDAYGIGEPIDYNPAFRNNHYKCFLRIYGLDEPASGRHKQKILWKMCPSGSPGHGECGCTSFEQELRSAVVDWDGSPQRFRIEWGGGTTRLLRNGEEQISIDWSASGLLFGPLELHFTLGSPRSGAIPSCGMPIGIVYSDLVVEGNEGPVATCEGPLVDEEELLPEPDAPIESLEETFEPFPDADAIEPLPDDATEPLPDDATEPLPEDAAVEQADSVTDLSADLSGDDWGDEGPIGNVSGGCGCSLVVF